MIRTPAGLGAAGLVLVLALAAAVPAADSAAAARRVPGEFVLLLPKDAPALRSARAGAAAAPEALHRLDTALAARGFARAGWLAADGRAVLVTGTSPDEAGDARARELVAAGVARAAAPNLHLDLAVTTPNDPHLATQWHLGTTAAGIRARNAWDLETGDPGVVIGIIDTGVDRTHPDLATRIWTNTGEVAANGLDDDGNGYVDDVQGWDFAFDHNDPNPTFAYDSTAGIDVGWHGTFAAGLAAAAGNNATGITGVAWDCRIMPLKVSNASGGITLASVTEAWAYALDNGASILSLSLAGTDPILEPFFQNLVNDAVDAGVVCVAAAGNSGLDDAHWPAACDSTLAVAATTNTNQRASFSCWGWYVNIAAPGQNVWSSVQSNYAWDASHQFLFSFLYGWNGTDPYMYNSGTSFSAPIVAGAVALVRSKYPGVPPKFIIDHMIATADVVAYDNPIGGRLNAYNALLTVVDVAPPPARGAPAARLGPGVPNPVRAAGTTLAFTLPAAGDVVLDVLDVRGRKVASLARGAFPAGTHRVRWSGAGAAPGLYFVAGTLGGAARSTRVTVLP